MDALDLYTAALFCLFGLLACGIAGVVEIICERRNARELHRHVWGNVVELKSWRKSKKRASGLKLW